MTEQQPQAVDMIRDAQLSFDGVYRYRLTRRWGGGPAVAFVMLNPSTADALVDDPTIRRCIGFAKGWGFDALEVVNLYALRSPNPRDLWNHPSPVGGIENDEAILNALIGAAIVVVAWGAHARPHRVDAFRSLVERVGAQVHALKVTKSGAPGHPLYLPASSELVRFDFGQVLR